MSDSIYSLADIRLRLAAMQKEAVSGADAVAYWPYQQEALPYFWNRLNALEEVEPLSGEMVCDHYSFEMGLVIAHLTQGYEGDTEQKVASYITSVLSYFDDHRDLTISTTGTPTAYRTPPSHLWIEDGGAMITGIPSGERAITNAGITTTQVVLGFILEVPLLRQVY